MSGGKASGSKQHEDTAADAALLALLLTHREATLLFAMAARRGATDSQIADALRQGLPHISGPDYLHDKRAGQQSEEKKVKHKGKKKRKTGAQPQLPCLAAALGAIPAEDWWRTWPADRTIMLRMTSKLVKSAADKLRPPAIVRVSRAFLDNVVCCKRERLLHILTELEKMTSRCRITMLDLKNCGMSGQDAGRLPGVLSQCPALSTLALVYNQIGDQGARNAGVLPQQCAALSHLALDGNQIGEYGARMLAGVLPQCPALSTLTLEDNQIGDQGAGNIAGVLPQVRALSHLNLRANRIGDRGAEILSGVLPQCRALSHMYLGDNLIGDRGAGSLAGMLPQCPALSHLDLLGNHIREHGAGMLAGVLPQCRALSYLYLGSNQIGHQGAGSLAGVLPQCRALSYLSLGRNQIRDQGAGSLAGVLPQCRALSHLDLASNEIGAEAADRLRAAWSGKPSHLVLNYIV